MSDGGTITLLFDGPPQGKARPRFGRGHAFTPEHTRRYERGIAWTAKAAMAGKKPIAGAVKVVALFQMPVPGYWPQARKAAAIAGAVRPTGKPDTDNLLKAALDGICGIVIVDDAQVCEVNAQKIFSVSPKTLLTVTRLDDAALPANKAAPLGACAALPLRHPALGNERKLP